MSESTAKFQRLGERVSLELAPGPKLIPLNYRRCPHTLEWTTRNARWGRLSEQVVEIVAAVSCGQLCCCHAQQGAFCRAECVLAACGIETVLDFTKGTNVIG